LKILRNLYVLITVVSVGGLLSSLATGWGRSGFGGGWCFISCAAGIVGVIWLGWYWLKLTGAISSLSRRLKEGKTARIESSGPALVKALSEAINSFFESRSNYTTDLENQVKELQVQLQLSRRQRINTESIIYSIRDAVIVIDEDDRLSMSNEAAGKLFEFDFENSRYQPIDELLGKGEGVSDFAEILRQSRQGKVKATRREIDFAKDGTQRTFDCIVSCIYDDKKGVCGVVAVLHDITREKEVSQMKNDFVSHVSHELKTPLASITAYAEMLVDGEADDPKTRKEFYSVIQNQAQRLNRLIEDILNISRIESGLIKVNKDLVSLTILIKEQFQMIKQYADEKKIGVTWGDSEQKQIVHDQVYADKDMISQVIVNLLSNAVKYTPVKGSINIESEIAFDENSQEVVRVSITDTGVWIPDEEVDYVFDKFYRVSAKKNRDQAKGTGLGLNLVKQIVEKVHNGRVFVRSKVGQGSTFGFELPLATKKAMETV